MTRTPPRTHFHSSTLVRCLAELGIVDVAGHDDAFAEKLSQWIHFADAIALSAMHKDGIAAVPKLQSAVQHDALVSVDTEFNRIKAAMTNSILKSFSPNSRKSHMSLPDPVAELPMNLRTAYVPYRRFYEAHQRDMELSIHPLRAHIREAVAKASPRLAKLAEVDIMLERILRDRENRLLSKVPVWLGKRFEQLFKEHQIKLEDAQQADNPAGWVKKDGWLTLFRSDMQKLLLAEMEFRLQPGIGLIEAMKQD